MTLTLVHSAEVMCGLRRRRREWKYSNWNVWNTIQRHNNGCNSMASEANKVMNCNDHQICWRVKYSLLVMSLLLGLQRSVQLLLTNFNILVQLLLFLLFTFVDDLQHIGAVSAVVVVIIINVIIFIVVVVDGLQQIVAVIVARSRNIFPLNTFIVCRTFLLSLFLNLNYQICTFSLRVSSSFFFCFWLPMVWDTVL